MYILDYMQFVCICSAQFANLCNFEVAQCKLKISKLLTNFKIAQPSQRNFQIVQPSLHNFKSTLCKLEIANCAMQFQKSMCIAT